MPGPYEPYKTGANGEKVPLTPVEVAETADKAKLAKQAGQTGQTGLPTAGNVVPGAPTTPAVPASGWAYGAPVGQPIPPSPGLTPAQPAGAPTNSPYWGYSADSSRTIERIGQPQPLDQGAFDLSGFSGMQQNLGQALGQANTMQQQAGTAAAGNLQNAGQSRALALGALTAPGPSAAESQLFSGQEAAARNALAMARSGRGFGSAGQLRQASAAGQEGMQLANQQAATLRAQEEQARRGQMLQLGGMDQAALGQSYQQQLGAGAQGLQALGQTGQLSMMQQQALADKAKTDAEFSFQQQKANAGYANYDKPATDNTGSIVSGVSSGLGALAGLVGVLGSDKRSKTKIQKLEDENRQLSSAFASLPDASNVVRGIDNTARDASRATGQAAGKAGSMAAALGAVPANTYEYRPQFQGMPGIAPGPQVGPMAQDLEKTLPGTVVTGPDGMKRVDAGRLALANSSATGELARRQQEMEERLRALGATG